MLKWAKHDMSVKYWIAESDYIIIPTAGLTYDYKITYDNNFYYIDSMIDDNRISPEFKTLKEAKEFCNDLEKLFKHYYNKKSNNKKSNV